MRIKKTFTILPVLLCLNAPVFAVENAPVAPPTVEKHGEGMGQPMHGEHKNMKGMGGKVREHQERHFKETDTNSDGKLSLEEMQAHAKSMFEKMDANKDGGVTAEEMREHHRAMREKMHKEGGHPEAREAPPRP